MKNISILFKEFIQSEKSGGLLLILCTIVSLIISNSSFSTEYRYIFSVYAFGHSIEHWINDGLMAIFFLLIGLELKREIYVGELSNIKDALPPMFAALGGMIIPASLYLFFNYNTDTQSGIGIPMGTDIAFALGILSLLGNRVPLSLKVFLTVLAVIDDIGAIIIIALFYTKKIYWSSLLITFFIMIVLLGLNKLKVKNL